MNAVVKPIEAEGEGGGLAPNARIVYVSPDQIARWRLDKSVALDNARWALQAGRPDFARTNLIGARFCHLQILRIKAHLRRRGGEHFPVDLDRLAASIAAAHEKELKHEEVEDVAPAVGAREPSAAETDEGRARGGDRERPESQRQVGVDISSPCGGEARPGEGIEQRRDSAGGDQPWSREALARLSPRELQVVKLVASGKGTEEIAEVLGIGVPTAYVYRCNVAKKLGVKTRALSRLAAKHFPDPARLPIPERAAAAPAPSQAPAFSADRT